MNELPNQPNSVGKIYPLPLGSSFGLLNTYSPPNFRCVVSRYVFLIRSYGTYDTIDRHSMWQILRMYGVGEKLLKSVQSFYVDSRACFRVGNDVNEWFLVNVGLGQGGVFSV